MLHIKVTASARTAFHHVAFFRLCKVTPVRVRFVSPLSGLLPSSPVNRRERGMTMDGSFGRALTSINPSVTSALKGRRLFRNDRAIGVSVALVSNYGAARYLSAFHAFHAFPVASSSAQFVPFPACYSRLTTPRQT